MPICVIVNKVMYSRNHCLYVPKVSKSNRRTRMIGVTNAATKPSNPSRNDQQCRLQHLMFRSRRM